MAKPREENLIFILGARGVGKTSLKNVISGREFNEKEVHSKIGITTSYFTVDDKNYCIKELTDNDNFSETKNLKYRLEEILLIFVVFSVDDENSLEYAKSLILFIKSNITYNLGLKIILIGNKFDSRKNNIPSVRVNQIEAENFSNENDVDNYYDISCKTGLNIEIISKIIEDINHREKYIDKDDENNHEDSAFGLKNEKSQSCIII